jgi:hypothetical protein
MTIPDTGSKPPSLIVTASLSGSSAVPCTAPRRSVSGCAVIDRTIGIIAVDGSD